MSYTICNDQELKNRIMKDLDLAVDLILGMTKTDCYAIWLIGGFGRGEGAVKRVDNVSYPQNNYDLLIVLKNGSSKEYLDELENIKKHFYFKTGIKLEVTIQLLSKVINPADIMIYRDIYNSSQTLFGPHARDTYRLDQSKPLPLIEAIKIITNRGMLWVSIRDNFAHYDYDLTDNQRNIWLYKTVYAYMDAILIYLNKYKTNYRCKYETILSANLTQFFNIKEEYEFKKICHQAFEFRTRGIVENKQVDLEKLEAMFLKIHLKILAKFHNKKFDSEELLKLQVKCQKKTPVGYLKSIYKSVREFGSNSIKLNLEDPQTVLLNIGPSIFYERVLEREIENPILQSIKSLYKDTLMKHFIQDVYIRNLV